MTDIKSDTSVSGSLRFFPDLTVFQDSFLPDNLQEVFLRGHGKGILHCGSLSCCSGCFPAAFSGMTVLLFRRRPIGFGAFRCLTGWLL